MKKYFLFIFILSIAPAFGQKEFKNQGEQENYWAEQIFEQKYSKQSFEKFEGKISVIDKTNIEFDNKSLEIWNIKPELLVIFTEGIFYPQIIIGREKNYPVKSESELKSLTNEERFLYNLKRNDKVRISNLEELPFLSQSPKIKRFRFWNYTFGFTNPKVYLIEFTNENATEKTELTLFIKGAKLTFVKDGWVIL